jgi:reactive intermediate/imine deaminase
VKQLSVKIMRLFAIAILLCATLAAHARFRAIAPTNSAPGSPGYSPGVEAGDYVYISGQGPRRPDGTFPESFEAQVRQCLDNVKAIVETAGLTLDHVVFTQVYLDDVSQYPAVNRVFGDYFGKTPPARAVLGVARLPEPHVQISAIAVRDMKGRRAIYPPNFNRIDSAAPGVLTHDQLFISSMPGSDPTSGKIPDDPAAQVDMALDRMQDVLKAAGLQFGNMVFVNPYLTARMPHRTMNEHYAQRFEFGNTPARATIEVSSLPGGAQIEYTGVAVRDLNQRRAVRPKNMPPSPTASPCVFAGNILYCSAKDGFIPGANGGIYATTTPHQLRQTMRNQLDNLEEAGMSFDEVVDTNVYLDDLSDLQVFDQVYKEYFGPIPPARTTIQQIAPAERKPDQEDHFPGLEQVSFIAVRQRSKTVGR